MSSESLEQLYATPESAEKTTDTATTNFGGITVVDTNSLLKKPHIKQFMAEISAHTQRILARSTNTKTRTSS